MCEFHHQQRLRQQQEENEPEQEQQQQQQQQQQQGQDQADVQHENTCSGKVNSGGARLGGINGLFSPCGFVLGLLPQYGKTAWAEIIALLLHALTCVLVFFGFLQFKQDAYISPVLCFPGKEAPSNILSLLEKTSEATSEVPQVMNSFIFYWLVERCLPANLIMLWIVQDTCVFDKHSSRPEHMKL